MSRKRDGTGDVHGMYIENIDGLYGLRAGLDAQPCRGGRPGTRDLCSRNKGDGKVKQRQQREGVVIYYLAEYMAQSIAQTAHRTDRCNR